MPKTEDFISGVLIIAVTCLICWCGYVMYDRCTGKYDILVASVVDRSYQAGYYSHSTTTDSNGRTHTSSTWHPEEYHLRIRINDCENWLSVDSYEYHNYQINEKCFAHVTIGGSSGNIYLRSIAKYQKPEG